MMISISPMAPAAPVDFKKRGFTLIELLIAIILTTGGLIVLMRMMSIGIFADSNLEYRLTAVNLANEKMEELKNTVFGSISAGTETGSAIGFDFVDNRVVSVTETETDLKDVKVEVQWTQKDNQESVEVETYIANY